ncbi:putative SprT family Zn-dependent metalloprotease [Kitasatospora sp. GP82]|nr:putative SprT family Zn-dependent metalloprotease [Kitasatospora sp. GP82]MDH6576076.1 putative SprT family Zn-dependent metalloprotease [Kitasatospora sp. MAP5-34]
MDAMRADYLKGETERRAKGYRYVCSGCPSHAGEVRSHGVA